jgi:hypothetical protein
VELLEKETYRIFQNISNSVNSVSIFHKDQPMSMNSQGDLVFLPLELSKSESFLIVAWEMEGKTFFFPGLLFLRLEPFSGF